MPGDGAWSVRPVTDSAAASAVDSDGGGPSGHPFGTAEIESLGLGWGPSLAGFLIRFRNMAARKPDGERAHTAELLAARCPHCVDKGRVRTQRVISAGVESASWLCTECDAEWTIVDGEALLVERRHGGQDRRAKSRTDRRKH